MFIKCGLQNFRKWPICVHNTRVECMARWHSVWGCSTWPPIAHRSPHHLKARTEDVGNSGPLACHISTSAQDTIPFIWFAFRLCPLTSGYSKLEDTSQPRQSLSSVKSKSFIWAQLGWRKKKNSSCARHAPFALHLHLSYVETRQPSLNDPLFRGCCLFQCLFQFAMLTRGKWQNLRPTLTPKPEDKRLLFL